MCPILSPLLFIQSLYSLSKYYYLLVTVYGSTVYIRRDCHGWSSIIAIHKEIFLFNFDLSSKNIKVDNMQKIG